MESIRGGISQDSSVILRRGTHGDGRGMRGISSLGGFASTEGSGGRDTSAQMASAGRGVRVEEGVVSGLRVGRGVGRSVGGAEGVGYAERI